MPLHIYRKDANQRSLVATLSFEMLAELEPVCALFALKTGIRLSEYDDTKLAAAHAGLLAQLISDHISSRNKKSKEIEVFRIELFKAHSENHDLFLVGE